MNQALRAEVADWLKSDADLHRVFLLRRAERLLQQPIPLIVGSLCAEADLLEFLREILLEEI